MSDTASYPSCESECRMHAAESDCGEELPPLLEEEEEQSEGLSTTPACGHNQWVRVSRMTGTVVSLQCRVCGCGWGTDLEWHTKCSEHFGGKCEKGQACPHVHIFKVQSKRRKAWRKQSVVQESSSSSTSASSTPVSNTPMQPTVQPLYQPVATTSPVNAPLTLPQVQQQFVYVGQPRYVPVAYPPSQSQVILFSLPQAMN
eukprot:TRINITY_DN518_c0_g1_i1.p1 TRINITY_DN518_c0_g1~~TRINITY_DN518_c0_g1_i1.p1  ORF type:complete len:201 (+),score=29.42 TRINITY_DN518_c0_g1_i1:154-756(+)